MMNMRSEEEVAKKLKELMEMKFDGYPFDLEFSIRNIDEYNTAIKVLKWILEK